MKLENLKERKNVKALLFVMAGLCIITLKNGVVI
mgnify:CR=1 FL=1